MPTFLSNEPEQCNQVSLYWYVVVEILIFAPQGTLVSLSFAVIDTVPAAAEEELLELLLELLLDEELLELLLELLDEELLEEELELLLELLLDELNVTLNVHDPDV